MGDDRPCNMKGISIIRIMIFDGMVRIMIFDGMVRELREVRYVPQLQKNLISIGALKALGFEISVRNSILKITRGSMVVLKGVRCNNVYYLKGSIVTGKMTTSISSDDDYTQL